MLGRFYEKSADLSQTTQNHEVAKRLGPKIAVIGGGTGLSMLLRGLKDYTENITAIVTVADDGGSSGAIREQMHMLPPGDIRNCILALSNTEPELAKLFDYRFEKGVFKNHSFGNLFLAALNGISGSFDEAVRKMSEILAITGRVVPVTTRDVHLEASFEDGSVVLGETNVFLHKKQHNCRISQIRLIPEHPPVLEDARKAILEADIIVLGPGSLYTSIIPNLLVDGVVDAVCSSDALKLYILNVMTQDGETEGYTASDHIRGLFRHSTKGLINFCLYNTGKIEEPCLKRYSTENSEPVHIDEEDVEKLGVCLCGYPVVSQEDGYVRHDPRKLAAAIAVLYQDKVKRQGIYGFYDSLSAEYAQEAFWPTK